MKEKIPSLNGLRALSIIFVLIGHVQVNSFKHTDAPGAQIGVNIFFIISGFLITLLLLKEENNFGSISLKNFYIRRVIRIFPVYYFILLFYFILQLFNVIHLSNFSWITSLSYTKYFHYPVDMETEHFWSLSVEEHFYLVWPVIFYLFRKYRVHFALAIIIVVPFIRLLSDISVMHLFTRVDSLMWGCLFAIYYGKILRYIQNKAKILVIFPFFILVACLITKRLIILLFNDFKNLEKLAIAFAGSFGTITNVCIGLIIIISINYKENIWFRFLNNPIINYIGILSYSIYIWQQIFFSEHAGVFSIFPYNIVLIFIVAALSYNFVELPFLKLKSKFKVKDKTINTKDWPKAGS